ncbi:hypothetical protein BKA69DRAFT_1074267 [Paraphysoderma sedebokerense]|nr:hypothetical protein BKA69DRAFT_1074267 [Paraphysoderma sedebokerense]
MKEQLIKTSVESKITLEQRQKEIESLNLERSLVSSQMTQLKDETASALDLKQTVARLQAQIDKLTAERQSVSRLLENALRHASKPEISALLKNVPTSDAQSDIIHSSTILYQLLCFYEIRNQELQARILSAEEHGVNGLRRSEIGENNEASRNEGSVMLSRLKSQYSELQTEHRRFFTEIKAMIQSLAKSNSFKLVVDLDKLQSTRDILDTLDYIFLKLCPPSRSFRHSCNAVVPDDVLPADANLLVISTQLLVSLEVAQATAKTAVSNSFLDEETNSGIQLQISTLRSSDSNQAIKVTNIIGGIKFLEIFITQFYQQFHSRHMKSIKNVAQKATKKHKLLISDLHKVQEDLSKANAELTRLRAWETESTEKLARLSILVEKGESYRRNAMERKNLGSSKQELRY